MKEKGYLKEWMGVLKRVGEGLYRKLIRVWNELGLGMDKEERDFSVGDFGD